MPTSANGRAVVPTVGSGATVSVSCLDAVSLLASVTVTVKVAVPAGMVGRPEMIPVVGESVTPAGRVPAVTLHVNGASPGVAARGAELYGTLTSPADSVDVDTDGSPTMRTDAGSVSNWLWESVAVTLNVYVPVLVGVPESTPAGLSVRPSGSFWFGSNDHVNGPVPA